MQSDLDDIRKVLSEELMTVLIRIGLVAFVVVMCVRIFAPFASIMLWALILAVVLYPLHLKLASRLGGRHGRAATLLVLAGVLLVGVPTVMLGSSFAAQMHDTYLALKDNTLSIPPPSQSVADWPVIGDKVFELWSSAAADLPALLKTMQPQLKEFASWMVSATAGTAGNMFLFIGSLIIAGIMMAYGEGGSRAILSIAQRIAGESRGTEIHKLSTDTVRSVASGVVGVAFIQALLFGIGFLMAGFPAAGVLALITLLLGIVQIPAIVVTLPAIAYLWVGGDGSTVGNILWTIYLFIAGLADNVLKPMLLGRGVDAPMPVVLIGALGGMVAGGILGLFIGAVVLAAGYQLFMGWVARGAKQSPSLPTEGQAVTTTD